ncbi:MAG: hypothetical protein QOE13_2692 [Gaiellaceae bacterium]|jgi:hypothetical protein|nr:hypothetical protein [Gaiellaceae bacterium]
MYVRTAALLAMLAAALTLGGGAGAGTASQQPKKIDLTNPAAVDSYLTSIGVNPATVVRQVGLLNYAGPASGCPGVGWNCTTSSKAVQVSSAGGQNKFKCSPEGSQVAPTDPETNTCVILQSGPDNKAQCQMKDTAEPVESQRCEIDQTSTPAGGRNLALVDQLIEQRKGPEQDARQLADVRQREAERNDVQIHQDVKQSTSVVSTGAQNQNVHQVALVYQQANGSKNFSHVHQNQDLSETGAATTQNQNLGDLPTTGPLTLSDCDQEHKGSASNPNACANVVQIVGQLAGSPLVVTGSGGTNESHLHQNISERAKTNASGSTQTQEKVDNGIEAHVDQFNPVNAGTNRKVSHQDARQRAEGGATQTQIIDPRCCGVGTTVGGTGNKDDFQQTAIQSASLGTAAFQRLGIGADSSHVDSPPNPELSLGAAAASSSTSSSVCRVHHDARNNTDSTQFTFTEEPCTFLDIETECFSASAAGPAEAPVGCTSPPDEGGPAVTLNSSPTFGNPIDPPNFGEPSDFPGPIFPGI